MVEVSTYETREPKDIRETDGPGPLAWICQELQGGGVARPIQ